MNTREDLKILQSLPLDVKILKSKLRIKEWYLNYNGNVYITFSGGKDSTVLKDLVHSIYPDVPVVFCDTGLEMKDVRRLGLTSDYILKPKMDFLNAIRLYGYPFISKQVSHTANIVSRLGSDCKAYKYFDGSLKGKSMYDMSKYEFLLDAPFLLSDKCCNLFKKEPSHKFSKSMNLYPYVGTMASESNLRTTNWLQHGCNMYDKDYPTSAPLSFWTENDILQYISENKLEIAKEYGIIENNNGVYSTTGESRTGCMFCGFGITKDTDRFLRLKEYDTKLYDYVLGGGSFIDGYWKPDKGLGYAFVIDWLNKHGNLNIKY